jgi:hypothetical protein
MDMNSTSVNIGQLQVAPNHLSNHLSNDGYGGVIITSSSGNNLVISNQSYQQVGGYYSSDGTWHDSYQQTPWTIPPTVYPGSYPPPSNPIIVPAPKDHLQSPPKDEKVKEGHVLTATMKICGDAVVVEYYCSHCDQIIHREVISKVPKRLVEEKCLPRIVKEVK